MISIHTPIWQLLFRELGTENRRGFNALNGLLSFLLVATTPENNGLYFVCQRPERASFISTHHALTIWLFDIVCQRPERASFISTGGDVGVIIPGQDVSTPWTGFFHFYTILISAMISGWLLCVNALNGLLSFLPDSSLETELGNVCQRPERASFISTHDKKKEAFDLY